MSVDSSADAAAANPPNPVEAVVINAPIYGNPVIQVVNDFSISELNINRIAFLQTKF